LGIERDILGCAAGYLRGRGEVPGSFAGRVLFLRKLVLASAKDDADVSTAPWERNSGGQMHVRGPDRESHHSDCTG
jgi:hypothetical protein